MSKISKQLILQVARDKNRSLLGACLAHALHDGYTDQLYAFLPAWQAQFGLSYMGLAAVRALYYGTMGGLQVLVDRLTGRLESRLALTASTLVAAVGFLAMALPAGSVGLCAGLFLAGVGSSLQHPRASHLVADTYGAKSRGALGIYNFSGDLGKAVLPAIAALLLMISPWRIVVGAMGSLGIVVAVALFALLPKELAPGPAIHENRLQRKGEARSGFGVLLSIGILDTAARMGYLLFLPFLINALGGSSKTVGLGLALLFSGGAFGKAACGWLGQRLGLVWSVVATEVTTGVLITATCVMPLATMLAVLPLLGIVLNGTSSVLYGTVPELAPRGDIGRAFALFYTGVIMSGGLAPIAYGIIGDHASRVVGILSSGLTALLIVPLVLRLSKTLSNSPGDGGS